MVRRIEPMRPERLYEKSGGSRTTAVRSPQSNGMAESFVKTVKRDYIEMMPKPDCGRQFSHRVRALQRALPAQCLGIPLTSGISAQLGITTLSGKSVWNYGVKSTGLSSFPPVIYYSE